MNLIKVWTHTTSLTPPLFIQVPVPSQERERSCIWVLWVSMLPIWYLIVELFRQYDVFCFSFLDIKKTDIVRCLAGTTIYLSWRKDRCFTAFVSMKIDDALVIISSLRFWILVYTTSQLQHPCGKSIHELSYLFRFVLCLV